MSAGAYDTAAARIDGDAALRRYRDTLLWGFGEGGGRKHWQWVAGAATADLFAWALAREADDGWCTTPTTTPDDAPAGWVQERLFDA